MYPKSVMLDYSSKEFLVSIEGYNAIKELIAKYQVCGKCKSPIDDLDRKLVGRNLCLQCLLDKQPQLTFLGPVDTNADGDITYGYSDPESVIYTSTANTSDEARKDIFASLTKAGFPVPAYYVPFKGDKDNPIKLGRYNWTIYGKLSSSVIVLEYSDRYPDIKAVFLSYKEGQSVELNKRNLSYKQMFERAKAVIERTKHRKFATDFYYHPDGHEVDHISDTMLYPIIAQFEAAVWDVQRTFAPAYSQPELTEAQPQELPVEENQGTEVSAPSTETKETTKSPRKHGKLSLVQNEAEQSQEATIE